MAELSENERKADRVILMSDNVKIYEIAREVGKDGIPSTELVEICQQAGFDEITHHSNAVPPDKAEEIRKAAIRLYTPDDAKKTEKKKSGGTGSRGRGRGRGESLAARKVAKKKSEEKKKKIKETEIPTTENVRPMAPPKPKGRGAQGEQKKSEARKKRESAEKKRARRKKKSRSKKGKQRKTRRKVVFQQPKGKPPEKKEISEITVSPPVTVRELSEKMGVSASELIKKLMMEHQIRANINQPLENEVIELLALEYEIEVTFEEAKSAEERLEELIPEDKPEDMEDRPPVIALLGHVDHGKTSILDQIRETTVAGTEDGGITQDIGAWQVEYEDTPITFVDTPGHEAFTEMRARGADVTDIVILVVAADDGVMAQTEEAIAHAQAAGVPIVVALNKIDKADANPMRAMQQLAGHELNPEEWGGDVGCVQLSALTGDGVDELLERTLLEAELLELQANYNRRADGLLLEASMQEGLGVVANVIVRNGTLHPGDIVVCGPAHGRVRNMLDQTGQEIEEAGPSTPVAVSGLDEVPEEGESFVVVEDLEVAREVAEERRERMEEERRRPRSHITLENLYESLKEGEEEQLRIVVKSDVKGTLDPLVNSLEQLETDEVGVRILHSGVGAVNVSDVLLADASDAVVVAFRVGVEDRAREEAEAKGVDIQYFRVIYEAVEAVHDAMEGMLAPELKEERLGVAEIRDIFRISSVGNIAGCYVRDGIIRRGGKIRLQRDGKVVHEGRIESLRRGKDDVREVENGYECGIQIQNYNDIQVGDLIECYEIREMERTLSS
ncbi:MAG: translation initiation factor IF-2 [Planctomycetota bacterium]